MITLPGKSLRNFRGTSENARVDDGNFTLSHDSLFVEVL